MKKGEREKKGKKKQKKKKQEKDTEGYIRCGDYLVVIIICDFEISTLRCLTVSWVVQR